MIFKRALLILVALPALNTFSGGVDVGNGGLTLSYEILIDQGFRSEQALTDYLDAAKYRIESGEEFNLSILRNQNGCGRKIQMQEMKVEEFYPYNNGMILPKEFKGLLKINLTNCKEK